MADLEDDDLEGLLPVDRTGADIGVRDNSDAALGADSDRPTLGSRIAGTAPPPAAATDMSGAPPDVKPAFDPNKVPAFLRPPTPSPNSIPTPPSGSSNPNLVDLAKQQGSLGKPTDPNTTDASGKQIYKMGTGGKVLGTIGNFLNGFGGGHSPITDVSGGATNSRYARAESMRQGNLSNVDTQIKTQQSLDSENEKAYRDAIKSAYDSQLGEARNKLGDAANENAATKATLAKTQGELNDAKADKLATNPSDQRATDADKYGLKGQARKDYILTGKLPKDFAGTSRAPTDLEMWHDAFKRDNGREPTADEISNRKARPDTKADQIEKDKDAGLQKAEAKATDRISKLKAFDLTDKRPIDQRKQAIYDDLDKEKAQVQKEYETRAAQNAASRPGGKPAAQPAKSPAKIDPNNLPKQVSVGGKLRNVAGYNKDTKKVILSPEGQ